MRGRWFVNGLLIASVLGLALILWLSRQPPPPPPPKISEIAPEAIHRIEVYADRHVIVLVKKAGVGWRIRRPVHARADPAHVAALLKLAATAASHRYGLGTIKTQTSGLADPAFVVRFNQEAPIAVGGNGPAPGSRYLRTAHALLLAPAPELHALALDWSHWIDPALIPADAQLTRIVLPRFTLIRNPGGIWQIAPTGRSRRDAQATVAAWQRVKALSVVAADPGRERSARITLDFANAPARHLDVIETDPHLILRDPQIGVDYQLAGNRVAPLLEARHPDLDSAPDSAGTMSK